MATTWRAMKAGRTLGTGLFELLGDLGLERCQQVGEGGQVALAQSARLTTRTSGSPGVLSPVSVVTISAARRTMSGIVFCSWTL